MWRWGQPVWWHLPVCLGGRPLQHHHKYSATTRHKYFCLLGGHTEQENHCAPNNALLIKIFHCTVGKHLVRWCNILSVLCCMVLVLVLVLVWLPSAVDLRRFIHRYLAPAAAGHHQLLGPALSDFGFNGAECGRERGNWKPKEDKWTHLWGGRGTWDKSWKWSLLSAIGQNSLLIVCQKYCYSTICNSLCIRVKKQKNKFHNMRLRRFCSLRKIFRSNVGCADLSQAWWCCLPLSDWHVPLSLPRRTTQAQSRATAKTRIVFQSILPKTLSSVYLVRQTTLLGFVLSIGGPARSSKSTILDKKTYSWHWSQNSAKRKLLCLTFQSFLHFCRCKLLVFVFWGMPAILPLIKCALILKH